MFVMQRSKQRGGSFSKDGYEYWGMFKEPKHKREAKETPYADDRVQGWSEWRLIAEV